MAQFSLRLFHGRDDPEANLDDWGFDGPVLGPIDAVQFTYGSIVLYIHPDRFELPRVDDLLLYGGKLYGDASIELASEAPPTEQFDELKADRGAPRAQRAAALIPLRADELRAYRACVEVFVDAVTERVSEAAGLVSAHALRRISRR